MTVMATRSGTRSWPRARVAARGARWRRLLEERWRDRVSEVTETALAYHDAAGAADPRRGAFRTGGPQADGSRPGASRAGPSLPGLLARATAARRALADVDDALARLAGGWYGLCESCGGAIPAQRLAAVPEVRYCPSCELPGLPPPRGRLPLTARAATR